MSDGHSGITSRTRLVYLLELLSKDLEENHHAFLSDTQRRINAVNAIHGHIEELMDEFCITDKDVVDFAESVEEDVRVQRLLSTIDI